MAFNSCRDLEKDITEPEAFIPSLQSISPDALPFPSNMGPNSSLPDISRRLSSSEMETSLLKPTIQPMLLTLSISPVQAQASGSVADLQRALRVIQSVKATAVE